MRLLVLILPGCLILASTPAPNAVRVKLSAAKHQNLAIKSPTSAVRSKVVAQTSRLPPATEKPKEKSSNDPDDPSKDKEGKCDCKGPCPCQGSSDDGDDIKVDVSRLAKENPCTPTCNANPEIANDPKKLILCLRQCREKR